MNEEESILHGPAAVSPRLAQPGPYNPLTLLSGRVGPAVANQPTTDPGFSLTCEEALIGCCFASTDAPFQVLDVLLPDHFLDQALGVTWKVIVEMIGASLQVDVFTFKAYVDQHGYAALVPEQSRLVGLTIETLDPNHVRSYATQTIEGFASRNLILASIRVQQIARQAGSVSIRYAQAAETLLTAEQKSFSAFRRGPQPLGDAVESLHDRIRDAGEKGVIGLTTSFRDLDYLLGGIGSDDLVLLAARPAMGKSTLATNIADYVASTIGPVLFFSGEMSTEQLLAKVISSRAQIDTLRMRRGDLSQPEWDRWIETAGRIKRNRNFIVDDRGRPPLNQILATSRSTHARTPLSLIVVDHLQLVEVESMSDNGAQRLGVISGSLKGLAKDLKVPVIGLSQLNRGVEQRDNKRPRMSDLRESGALEQDSDTVAFIYRDDYYHPDRSDAPGMAEIIIGKSRHGKTGSVMLGFEGEFSRFVDPPEGYQSSSRTSSSAPKLQDF